MDLNRAMIIGNMTRDPEVRQTPSGQKVASFGVATNRYWTDASGTKQSAVEYHNIVVWRRLADIAEQYLKKGKKIYVEGRIETRDWTGQDGVKRNKTEIVADNIIMLDGARGGYSPATAGSASSFGSAEEKNLPQPSFSKGESEPQSAAEPTIEYEAVQPQPTSAKEEEIKVEDIPF